MKLEIKHLATYLPFEVKVIDTEVEDCIWTLHPYKDSLDCLNDNEHISLENFITENNATKTPTHKLLLRPLSDLTKEIEIDGKKFVPMEYFFEFENPHNKIPKRMKYYYEEAPHRVSITHNASSRYTEVLFSEMGANPYWMIQKLFEWHFDVFGLIDQGLALPLI